MLNVVLLLAGLVGLPAHPDPEPRPKVLWTPESFATMSFLYSRVTAVQDGVEFAACLGARREGLDWVVTAVVVPAQSGTANGVEDADCTGYQGAAHSHPLWEGRRACLPSLADRASFAASSHDFFVIWCDLEAFTFRTRDLGIGGKDDTAPNRAITSSAEPHLWRDRGRPTR